MASPPPHSLDCAVIGAGIAGLAAAIALRRAGHRVELFEKSTFKNEIGAAITITPNGNLVLDRWGFDAAKAAETEKQQSRFLNSETLEVKAFVEFDDVYNTYSHKFNAYHRVDLHNQLREMALAQGAIIHLGAEATDIDCAKGSVIFKDGSQTTKDLVVVADGIRSNFVQTVSGADVQVKKIGRSVFRGLIPIKRLLQDPIVKPLFENQKSGFCSTLHPKDSGVLFITYPCRNDEIMNVAVFHTTRPGHEDDIGWNNPATKEEVLSVLGGMNPLFPAIINHSDQMNCFPIVMRDVIPRYHNGKVILIGDAAHPMQPTHAQGACISLEDAAALEILFSDWDPKQDVVESRSRLFTELRLPRGNTTVLVSNGMFYEESLEASIERIRKYYTGPLLPAKIDPWTKPHQEFFYPYNIFEQAEKAMAYKDAEKLPQDAIRHFFPVAHVG